MHPFDKVVGRCAGGKVFGFAPQLRLEGVADRRLEQRFGPGIGFGRAGSEPSGQGLGFRLELFRRDDAVDETERQGTVRIKAFAGRVSSLASLSPTIPGSNAVMPPSGLVPR